MKKIILSLAIIALASGCKKEDKNAEVALNEAAAEYAVFGDSISAEGALSYQEMTSKFGDLKPGGTHGSPGLSSPTRGLFGGGYWSTAPSTTGPYQTSFIGYITISSKGNTLSTFP